MMKHTERPRRACMLKPIEMASAFVPLDWQCPLNWHTQTLMVSVAVLDRAGEPLSVMTTWS